MSPHDVHPRRATTLSSARVRTLAAFALAAFLLSSAPAWAAPPPDDEIAKAEQEQDKALAEARRAGSAARLVPTYESRFGRQQTALNRYLYGRALFHADDKVGALREMRAVVAAEGGFWQAHIRIAYLLLEQKNGALARQHLDRARALRPDAPEVHYVSVDVGLQTQDWDLALKALERLAVLRPGEEQIQALLAEVQSRKGDWPAAYAALRPLRLAYPKEPRLRSRYALAAFRAGHLAEAALEFEDLAKGDPGAAAPYLEVLIAIYFQQAEEKARKNEPVDLAALERAVDRMKPFVDLSKPDKRHVPYLLAKSEVLRWKKDWQGLIPVLEALLPYTDPAQKTEVERTIAALKAGEVPGAMPRSARPPPSEEELMVALLERCFSPRVETRRAALQEFYDLKPIGMPRPLLLRFHPSEEPDPECRAWVVKTVGAMKDAGFAKVAGHALQDPEGMVRRIAAEALGTIAAPAGLLYLLTYVPVPDDAPFPPDAPEGVVKEYNAARLALVQLTGFDDIEIGAPRWVAGPGVTASWARWKTWLASPDGVRMKLKAIDDLLATGETHPEWYLLMMVWDDSTEVAKAAYDRLLARSLEPTDDPVGKQFWPTFPKLATKADGRDLTPAESLADVKKRIGTWWAAWRAARDREAAAPAPAGTKPGTAPAGGGK